MSIFIWAASRLPSTYQEVEYIESSWTQYINLWMVFTNNVNVEMDIAFTAARSGWSGIIWANKQNSSYSWAWGISASSMTYQKSGSSDKHIDWSWTPTLNEKYNFSLSGSTVKRDGTTVATISWTIGTYSTPINATLFKVASQSSSNSWFPYNVSARIYYCKVYSSGTTLARNLVPCYRKSDSVIWMYDLVNSTFYTNAWTWTFTKWADVYLNKLKEAYLWAGKWQPTSNTYAYYPLTENANDYSGNNRNLTAASAITYSESNWAYLPNSAHTWMVEWFNITTSWTWTFSWWQKTIAVRDGDCRGIDIYWGASSRRLFTAWNSNTQTFNRSNSNTFWSTTETANVWYLNTVTLNNGTLTSYVNGVQLSSGSVATGYTSSYFRWGQEYNNGANRQLYGYLKDIIIENKVWTATEISDYYNSVKWNYWL